MSPKPLTPRTPKDNEASYLVRLQLLIEKMIKMLLKSDTLVCRGKGQNDDSEISNAKCTNALTLLAS